MRSFIMTLLSALVLIGLGLLLTGEFNEEEVVIQMRGEVVLPAGHPCADGTELMVQPRGGGATDVRLLNPELDGNGCAFTFTADVARGESYTFIVTGLPSLTRQTSLIDTVGPSGETELDVLLIWDR